jgi:hypothetical protein
MREEIVEACVARHRHERSPAINLNLPVFPNLDVAMCRVVTSDLAGVGSHWECSLAVRDLWRTLPAQSGLYMFVFRSPLAFGMKDHSHRPSWVLYVGRAGSESSANTIKSRYKESYSKHLDGDPEALWSNQPPINRDERLARYLTIYPIEFWWLPISDRTKIKGLEDHLIKLLDPLLNASQRLRLKAAPAQPAFRKY